MTHIWYRDGSREREMLEKREKMEATEREVKGWASLLSSPRLVLGGEEGNGYDLRGRCWCRLLLEEDMNCRPFVTHMIVIVDYNCVTWSLSRLASLFPSRLPSPRPISHERVANVVPSPPPTAKTEEEEGLGLDWREIASTTSLSLSPLGLSYLNHQPSSILGQAFFHFLRSS